MTRAFWYGRNSQIHAIGAAAATLPTPTPTHHHGNPASNRANLSLIHI